MITFHQVEQGSEAWHALRAGKYTGSNAAKLLRYGAINYSRTERTDFSTFYTKRGHKLEPEAIKLFERITGRSVQRPGFVTNSRYPSCGYSPDGICDDTLIEVKCFNRKKHLAIYKGEVPFEVLAQVYFGLLICGLKEARLVIYNPEFAKKGDPEYDPKLAIKVIEIKAQRSIQSNLRRILTKE